MAGLRAITIVVFFLVLTALGIPLQWMALKFRSSLAKRIPVFYHRMVCRLIGVRITVIGVPAKGATLMAANHSGWLDIPILSTIRPVSFIAKQEVAGWALFGQLAILQETIFVRRGERAKVSEDRDKIRRRLMAGDALVMFPEGTSSDGNRVLAFKSALFGAAELPLGENSAHHIRHAPVQPVSIAYVGLHGMPMGRENRPFFAWYGDMELVPHLWEAFARGPIDVVVELHKPLTIDDAGGRKELAAAAERMVRAGLARALAGAPPAHAPAMDQELIEALGEDEEESEEVT
jgi:1-acyl-sn-glycerol-3-phosphate acyltransferase